MILSCFVFPVLSEVRGGRVFFILFSATVLPSVLCVCGYVSAGWALGVILCLKLKVSFEISFIIFSIPSVSAFSTAVLGSGSVSLRTSILPLPYNVLVESTSASLIRHALQVTDLPPPPLEGGPLSVTYHFPPLPCCPS